MSGLFITLLFPFISMASIEAPPNGAPKVLTVTVSRYNQVFIGRDTLSVADLSKELKNRLWKSYLGTGKMHDGIILEAEEGVTEEMKVSVQDAIKKGQQMALKDICLEKHKQYFESLSERQQEKMHKQFPVLFQTDYSLPPDR